MRNFKSKKIINGFLAKIVPPVFAQIEIENPIKAKNIGELIERIVQWLWYLAWVIAPLLILVGAFYLLTSGGNTKRVAQGKRMIIFALIGVVLILVAKSLIGLVLAILGISE